MAPKMKPYESGTHNDKVYGFSVNMQNGGVLIDNIFVKFGGCLSCQVIGIPMGTNCAPLLADLFLYSYESEFLDNI